MQTLAQILDPSLTDKDLGAFLAQARRAGQGRRLQDRRCCRCSRTARSSAQATDGVVKDVLGGTVKNPEPGAAVRVVHQRTPPATKDDTEKARVALVNGGYTFVDGGTDAPRAAASRSSTPTPPTRTNADEVAKTLGLPAGAVKKGKVASNADIVGRPRPGLQASSLTRSGTPASRRRPGSPSDHGRGAVRRSVRPW